MQIDFSGLTHSVESWKFLLTLLSMLIGAAITGYKGYQWVKDIREKDLPEIKTSLDTGLQTVSTKIEDTSTAQLRSTEFQTSAIVRELSELRSDFRAYFNPPTLEMTPVRSKAAPKRKAAKAPAKKAKAPRRLALAPAKKK